jgi:hypothetical protein
MKNFLTVITVTALLSVADFHDCRSQGYDITVKINNLKDTVAYLGYSFGDQKFVKDTSKVLNGNTLVFRSDTVHLPRGVYFIYSAREYFDFIVNEQKFSLETDAADLIGKMKVYGSRENSVFNEFQKFSLSKQDESSSLSGQVDSLLKKNDSLALKEIRNKLTVISKEVNAYQDAIINSYPGTFVAKLIAAMQRPAIPETPPVQEGAPVNKNWKFYFYKEHFFDHFDLADSGLLRSPVYQPRIDEYLDNLTLQHPDSIEAAVDFLLKKASSNKETFRYLLVKLTSKYEGSNIMGMEGVFVYLAQNYYLNGKADWADSALLSKFATRVKALLPNLIGKMAPPMQLVDSVLQPVRLSDMGSRFIILYFYDHDCGHCKEATSQLSDLYDKRLRPLGVRILAADVMNSLQSGEDPDVCIKKWKEFIQKYQLRDWINAADPYLRDNFRANYNIESTPTIYILNSKLEIIAKRLGVDQLEDFIRKMIEMEDGDKS